MLKFLTYTVAVAILAVLGFDTYAVITHTATPLQAVEAAVGIAAILAIAIAAFIKAVSGSWSSFRSRRKVTLAEVADNVDTLDSKVDDLDSSVDSVKESVDDLDSKVDGLDSKVDDISETLDERLGPAPFGFVATVNTLDENGKLVRLYDLPVSDSYEEAVQDAKDSVEAREEEGNPVQNARITVVPVFTA